MEVENVAAYNALSRVLTGLGKYPQALLQAQKSLKLDPSQAEMFVHAGEILLRMGREQEAEMSFLKALQVNNYLVSGYQDLITLYSNQVDTGKLMNILSRYYGILPPRSREAQEIADRLQKLKSER